MHDDDDQELGASNLHVVADGASLNEDCCDSSCVSNTDHVAPIHKVSRVVDGAVDAQPELRSELAMKCGEVHLRLKTKSIVPCSLACPATNIF